MSTTKFITACIAVASLSTPVHAAVDIVGNNEQTVKADKSPVSTLAIGPAATAKTAVASNEGKVKIGGNNRQIVDLQKSPVSTLAIGPAAKATTSIGSNSGN